MKFEEYCPRDFKGKVVQRYRQMIAGQLQTASDQNSSSWAFGSDELKYYIYFFNNASQSGICKEFTNVQLIYAYAPM